MNFLSRTALILLAACSIVFSSCDKEWVKPSGDITTETHSFDDYDQIEVGGDFEVDITFSETEQSIEIEADDNLHEFIEVKRTGSTLVIKMENNVCTRGDATLLAHIVTAPLADYTVMGDSKILFNNTLITDDFNVTLMGDSEMRGDVEANSADLDAKGDSKFTLNTISVQDKFSCDLSGDSEFRGTLVAAEVDLQAMGDSKYDFTGVLETPIIEVDLSGGSEMTADIVASNSDFKALGDSKYTLAGTCDDTKVDLSGDSQLTDYDFVTNTLDAKLMGDSEVYITVNEDIKVNASGDSSLYFKGDATISQENLTGDSKVRNMN